MWKPMRVGVLVCLLAPALARAGSIEGRWRLVEQTYGAGSADLVAAGPALHLEFAFRGAELAGRTWSGESPAEARSWPSWTEQEGSPTLRVEERSVAPDRTRVLVRYEVVPVAGDDLRLEVVEDYHVDDADGALVGEVRVALFRGGAATGSYVLHRRFERER